MSFHDQQYNEKRDFIRMKVQTTATLTAHGEQLSVECQDLSSQGVQVMLDKALTEGTKVQLSIPSPTEHLKGLQASGQVTRCTTDEKGRYVVGIQFDSLD